MAHLLLTRGRRLGRRNLHSFSNFDFRVGKITMSIAVISLFVMISFSYLTISNESVTQGYRINDLKLQKANLLDEKESIATKVDEATAIRTIQAKAYEDGMRANKTALTYLDEENTGVAKK